MLFLSINIPQKTQRCPPVFRIGPDSCMARIQWEGKCEVSPEPERVPEIKKLRSLWVYQLLPTKFGVIYRVHLTVGKMSQKEDLVIKNGISRPSYQVCIFEILLWKNSFCDKAESHHNFSHFSRTRKFPLVARHSRAKFGIHLKSCSRVTASKGMLTIQLYMGIVAVTPPPSPPNFNI